MRRHRDPFVPPPEDDGYDGSATLHVDDRTLPIEVHLAHHFEPLDGRTHWYGRIQRNEAVTALKESGATTGTLRIDEFVADARLAEFDAWGNVAVKGVGAPPYAVISGAS